jgi:alpha-2-macroglobulin
MLSGLVLALYFTDRGSSQTPAPAAPTEQTEAVDLSKPPIRSLSARISANSPTWNEEQQRVEGPAATIYFHGPAAPLDLVGKAAPAGAIQITPEVAGEWRWQQADRLAFFPSAGWLPPGVYRIEHKPGLLAEDCEVAANSTLSGTWNAPALTARFQERSYYIDPATPSLQQLVTTVDFSQPVSLEEARRNFSVTSVTGIEIFQPGSKAQLLPDPRNPTRFYLRSPLMKPGDKEDLVLFSFKAGLKAKTGGKPTAANLETKLTAYSKDSAFFVSSICRKNASEKPRG